MRILGIDHIGIASGDLGKHIEILGDRVPDGDQVERPDRDSLRRDA